MHPSGLVSWIQECRLQEKSLGYRHKWGAMSLQMTFETMGPNVVIEGVSEDGKEEMASD